MAQALRTSLQAGGLTQGGLRPGLGGDNIFASSALDLNFGMTKSLGGLVTFTRASSGTYVGSDGLLKTATTNEPRFDHNPTTGESLGLLVEEQRTNSIRNNTMVGAVAGTPGTLPTNWSQFLAPTGITRSVVGTGTENGISYVDIRFNGTASGAGELSLFPEASNTLLFAAGTTLSTSAWLSIVGGSTVNISSVRLRALSYNVGTYLSEGQQTVALTSQLSRYTLNGYTTAATSDRVSYGITAQCTAAGAIDITLRIGLPQLEQGAFVTSVIPTTGTAATRSADVASITGTNFSSWYRQDEGSVFSEFALGGVASQNKVVNIDAGAGFTDSIDMYCVSGTPRYEVYVGSAVQAQLGMGPSIGTNVATKVIGAYKANDFGATRSGGVVITDGSGTIPSTVRMGIGAQLSGGQYLNGTIRRLSYWPARLPNSTLEAITR